MYKDLHCREQWTFRKIRENKYNTERLCYKNKAGYKIVYISDSILFKKIKIKEEKKEGGRKGRRDSEGQREERKRIPTHPVILNK